MMSCVVKEDRISMNNSTSSFTEEQNTILMILTASVAGISFFCCLFVIFLIVIFKKYMVFMQRLILYLDIGALLTSLARTINISIELDSVSDTVADRYCQATGFIDQYTSACFLIAIAIFTIDIFLQVSFSLQTKKLEALYVLLIFFLPAFYCWVPFYYKAYGKAGPWCWIKGDNKEQIILQFALFYIPCFVVYSVLFVLVLTLMCLLYLRRYNYDATIDLQTVTTRAAVRKEVKKMLVYPAILMVLNIVPLVTRIYDACGEPLFELWVANAIIAPLEGAVVAIVFTFDPETRKRLTPSQLFGACLQFCDNASKGQVSVYPAEARTTTTDSYLYKSTDKEPLLKEQQAHQSFDSTM